MKPVFVYINNYKKRKNVAQNINIATCKLKNIFIKYDIDDYEIIESVVDRVWVQIEFNSNKFYRMIHTHG